MRWSAIILSFVASAAIPGAVSGSAPLQTDREVRVYSVINAEGYSYKLYLDAERTECVDALPSSDQVKLRLDRAANEDWRKRSVQDFRVKVRHEKMTGFPPSLQIDDHGQVLVSSSGGIFYGGRQLFLQCQDYSATDYDVYFIEEAFGD